MTTQAFDLADRLQTVVFVMSDLDLGMNNHMSPPLKWENKDQFDKGKVLDAEALEEIQRYGRYLDVDGDGICYRTIPGTHPTKGSFFTRGTSKNVYAQYSEDGADYVINVDRLDKKWETAKQYVPKPIFDHNDSELGVIFFGTSTYAVIEAIELLEEEGIKMNAMRIRAFPFNDEAKAFIDAHEKVFVVEQNRHAQFKTLMVNEMEIAPSKLISILNYDGTPITADTIMNKIKEKIEVSV
ncbi:MAG: hypothetical protein R2728_14755 [Chitinophagales bacterium]